MMKAGTEFFNHFWSDYNRSRLKDIMTKDVDMILIDDDDVRINGRNEVLNYLNALHDTSLPKLDVITRFENDKYLSVVYKYHTDDKPEMNIHEFELTDGKISRIIMIIDSILDPESSDEEDSFA